MPGERHIHNDGFSCELVRIGDCPGAVPCHRVGRLLPDARRKRGGLPYIAWFLYDVRSGRCRLRHVVITVFINIYVYSRAV